MSTNGSEDGVGKAGNLPRLHSLLRLWTDDGRLVLVSRASPSYARLINSIGIYAVLPKIRILPFLSINFGSLAYAN